MDYEYILGHIKDVSIAVIGDICLDVYYFLSDKNTEVSLETGLETRSVANFKFVAGGAGNVAVNCEKLKARTVDLYGIIGDDQFGTQMKSIFMKNGIDTSHIITQADQWDTHVYHKIYQGSTELPRYDLGNFNLPSPSSIDALITDLRSNIESYDVIIVNEQVIRGLHNVHFQDKLNEIINSSGENVLWISDCRSLHNKYTKTIHKLNLSEACSLLSLSGKDKNTLVTDEDLVEYLYGIWKSPVVVTRGENGCITFDGRRTHGIRGLHIINRTDTVGAGDAFISAFAASLAAGAAIEDAAAIGNFSAGVSVQKLYETGNPEMNEIKKIMKEPYYRYNPSIASGLSPSAYYHDTEIEIINDNAVDYFADTCLEFAVFDHDGTVSTLREGWEEVMRELMVRSITDNRRNITSPEHLSEIERSVDSLISRTTGLQTIAQMKELRELVKACGLVEKSSILSPEEYKNWYNVMLMERVCILYKKLRKSSIDRTDITIKGSVPFIERLRSSGITLYLASGTDTADVLSEARMLGYNTYFNGGIYGSTGQIDKDPKKMVLETILSKAGRKGTTGLSRGIIFGDGPVEMREGKKNGMITVGVLSDEKKRFGLNLSKKERLVLAGADLLIPDFSVADSLMELLGCER